MCYARGKCCWKGWGVWRRRFPLRGPFEPWPSHGTSACVIQSAATQGQVRRGRAGGGERRREGDGRRYHNVIIRCLENKRQFSELKKIGKTKNHPAPTRHGYKGFKVGVTAVGPVPGGGCSALLQCSPLPPGPVRGEKPQALTCFLYLSLEALNFPLVAPAQGGGRCRPYAILPHLTACLGCCHLSVLRGRELPGLRAPLSLQ